MSERPQRQRKRRKKPSPAFEEAVARLEEIAQQLEDGNLPLEEAISLAEEGLELSELCEKHLTKAEGKIRQLVARMERTEFESLDEDTGEADEEA